MWIDLHSLCTGCLIDWTRQQDGAGLTGPVLVCPHSNQSNQQVGGAAVLPCVCSGC